MEVVTMIFDALNAGADTLWDLAFPFWTAYLVYMIARLKSEIFSGVPAFLRAFVVAAFDAAVMPLVKKYVALAEAEGKTWIDSGMSKLRARVKKYARVQELIAWLQRLTPDWLLSDERVRMLVESALIELGMVAVRKIEAGVQIVADEIKAAPAPPPAPAA